MIAPTRPDALARRLIGLVLGAALAGSWLSLADGAAAQSTSSNVYVNTQLLNSLGPGGTPFPQGGYGGYGGVTPGPYGQQPYYHSRPGTLRFPPSTFPQSQLMVGLPSVALTPPQYAGTTAQAPVLTPPAAAPSRTPDPTEPQQIVRTPEPAPSKAPPPPEPAVVQPPAEPQPSKAAPSPPPAEPPAMPMIPPPDIAAKSEPVTAPSPPPEPKAQTRVAEAPPPAPEPAPPPAPEPAVAEPAEAPPPPAKSEPLTPPPPSAAETAASSRSETTTLGPAPAPQSAALPPADMDEGGLRLTFEEGKAELSEAAKGSLKGLAANLIEDGNARVQLLAFASSADDSASRARRLSLSRALAVRAYLIDQGVRSTRMDVRALGNKSEGGPPDRVDILPARR